MSAYQKNNLHILCCFILLLCLPARPAIAQSGTPTVACTIGVASMPVGGQTELLLEIRNIQNFYGYELTLNYDPAIVEILDSDPNREQVNVALGDFVSQDFLMLNEINQPGELLLNLMQINPTPPRSGNGVLARIKVQGSKNGVVNFTLTDVLLYDTNGAEIPHEVKNCSLQIAGAPVPTPTATSVPPTATDTSTPTATPTITPTPEATATMSPAPTTDSASPVVTATNTPPVPTATFFPTPAPTLEPTLTPAAPTVIAQAETPVITPTATTFLAAPPAVTPFTPVENSGVVIVETAPPAPTPPVAVASLSTIPSLATPVIQIATAVATNAPTNSPQVGELVAVTPAGSSPLAPLDPSVIVLYVGIGLLGLLAVGAIGFELIVFIIYLLVVRLQAPQQTNLIVPGRRARYGKAPLMRVSAGQGTNKGRAWH